MRGKRLTELWIILGLAAASAIVGVLTGWLPQSLLIGLLLYTAWHVRHLAVLPGIIRKQRRPGRGVKTGLWDDVLQSLEATETDSRQREDELRRALDHFRAAIAALPDAVAILQADGRLEWSNAAADALLGIPGDATGQPILSIVSDPILGEYLSAADFTRPLTLSAPGDRTRTLLLHVLTIGDESRARVIVAQDISRQYHLDVSQRDFIANVSHELRTPLTVITGLLEQLDMNEPAPATGRRMIEIMQNQTQRMRDLIDDLLTLTQIEAGDQSPQDRPVPVPELLATIIEEAGTLASNSGHVLIPEIDPVCGLRGNAGELRTAFTNLVVNAIRYTPARAEIRVRWSADETGARFTVSDTGEGIAARHIPRLTERFYRVDQSRSRDTGGTGLGLAIVRQVLEKHDGRLEISSEVGRGSSFTCRFPASRIIDLTTPGS